MKICQWANKSSTCHKPHHQSEASYTFEKYFRCPPRYRVSQFRLAVNGLGALAPLKSNIRVDKHFIPIIDGGNLALSRYKLPVMMIWSHQTSPAPAKVSHTRRNSTIGIHLEPNIARESIILYIHGGAYVTGSFRSHGGFSCELGCRAGQKVCFLEYRLAPEYPAPTAVDDAVHTFKWLTEDRGYKPQNVTLAGDSAGGAVCLLLMLKLKKLNLPMPGGAFLMSPWTDMSVSQPSFASNAKTDVLLGNEPNILLWALGKSCLSELTMERLKSPDISPLYAEDLSGFPPLLIHAGSYERLVDDSIQFAEKAKAHGVPVTLKVWQCQQHVFQCFFNFIPEASEALDEAAAWIANKSSRVTNQPTNNLVS